MAKYEITDDGKILDDGQEVGHFNEKDELILKEGAEISPQAQGYLKRKHFGSPEPGDLEEEMPRTSELMKKKAGAAKKEDDPEEEEEDDEDEEDKGAPKQDPRMGDKTPAYVQWLAKNKPEEFKKRYAGRKILGQQMPSVIKQMPKFEQTKVEPIGSDVPESSMAKEAPEQWMRKR